MLTVCAWCPKTLVEESADARGEPVSHGICEQHYLGLMEGLHECGHDPYPASVSRLLVD